MEPLFRKKCKIKNHVKKKHKSLIQWAKTIKENKKLQSALTRF